MKTATYVANTRNTTTAHQQATSTGTGDVKTITLGSMTSGVFLTVETNPIRVTFDGVAPDATHGIVIPKDSLPLFVPVGPSTVIKFATTSAATSILSSFEVL